MYPLYVLLGVAGTKRRDFLARFLPTCRDDESQPILLWTASSEAPAPADEALAALPNVIRAAWRQNGERVHSDVPRPPENTAAAFLLGDGLADPRDLLEALPTFLSARDLRLARIITWVNGADLLARPKLQPWYDLAFHFSDAILLRREPTVPSKFCSAFERRLETERHPAVRYELNLDALPPAEELLYPEARRLTTWFDTLAYDPTDTPVAVGEWPIEASSDDEDEAEGEDTDDEPMFERDLHGRRVVTVPDLKSLLA